MPLLCVIAWLHSVAKVALGISRVPLDVGGEALWHWKSASLVVKEKTCASVCGWDCCHVGRHAMRGRGGSDVLEQYLPLSVEILVACLQYLFPCRR